MHSLPCTLCCPILSINIGIRIVLWRLAMLHILTWLNFVWKVCQIYYRPQIFLGQDCPWPVCCLDAPYDASIAALAFAFFSIWSRLIWVEVHFRKKSVSYILWLFQIISFPVVSDYCQVCRELKNKEGLNIAFASFSILHRVAQTRTNTGQHDQFQGNFWHA